MVEKLYNDWPKTFVLSSEALEEAVKAFEYLYI